MADLAELIRNTAGLDRPVVDRTGLVGIYEIRLVYTPESRIGRRGSDADDISIFEALPKQLGLKLEQQQAPFDMLFIDHIEKPSPN